ncbi:hypothetical protein QFZ27_004659 [Inquilinus ginsengisoli]|uniref:hypothetical protein n=1 Tax=Inquilinus ginsengisoli TaxID=363840 RepID=UPI003D1D58B3
MIEQERRTELRTFLASVAVSAALVIPVTLILPRAGDGYEERVSGRPVQEQTAEPAPAHVQTATAEPIVIVKWTLEAEPTWYVGPLSTQRERMIFCLQKPKYCTIEMRGG